MPTTNTKISQLNTTIVTGSLLIETANVNVSSNSVTVDNISAYAVNAGRLSHISSISDQANTLIIVVNKNTGVQNSANLSQVGTGGGSSNSNYRCIWVANLAGVAMANVISGVDFDFSEWDKLEIHWKDHNPASPEAFVYQLSCNLGSTWDTLTAQAQMYTNETVTASPGAYAGDMVSQYVSGDFVAGAGVAIIHDVNESTRSHAVNYDAQAQQNSDSKVYRLISVGYYTPSPAAAINGIRIKNSGGAIFTECKVAIWGRKFAVG
jgi:hypothetical protein